MADQSQGQNSELENPESNQFDSSALNPEEAPLGEVSPAPQDDNASRLAALEAQLARERERNELLERSAQIQERFWAQQAANHQQPQAAREEPWPHELEVLDRALDPLLRKRLGQEVAPLRNYYSAMADESDALRFEMFLQRNNPDVLEDEDAYNRTMQQVEAIRQTAAQRGMQVSRVDAFVFNEGFQGTRQKITERKQKRGVASAAESRRQAEIAAATGTSMSGAPRSPANAGIQAIRDKANRGERLTPDERAKLREFVSGVQF